MKNLYCTLKEEGNGFKKKKVTIQDIADELSLSRNTVSKAINNTEGISESPRQSIRQKAVEIDCRQFSYVQTQTQTPQKEAEVEERGSPC